MSIKIKLFKKLILFSAVLFLQSCSYFSVGYGSIEGTVSFSQQPISPQRYHIVKVNEYTTLKDPDKCIEFKQYKNPKKRY